MDNNLSDKYYQKNKERLKKACERKRKKVSISGTLRHKNLPEHEKQRLLEYRKSYKLLLKSF